MTTYPRTVQARERRNDRRKPVRVPALVNSCDAIVTDISLGGVGGMLLPDLGQQASFASGQRVSLTMPKDHDDRLIFQLLIAVSLAGSFSWKESSLCHLVSDS